MKIIEKGTRPLPEEIVYIKKCEVCGCKFTYTIEDMFVNVFWKYDRSITCPQCKCCVKVPFIKKKYKNNRQK